MMKQGFGNRAPAPERTRKALAIALVGMLAAAIAAPLPAADVYSWTDEDGVTHFSDTPRPDGDQRVIEAEEAYRPGSVELQTPPAAESGAAAEQTLTAAQARRAELRESGQARRERQQEQQQLCAAHRQRLEQMEPARRVFYVDEAGNQVRMDDEQRVNLVEESKAFLDDNCAD